MTGENVGAWGRLRAGDVVVVRGERGRFVVLSFHVEADACRWANVAGGRGGRHMVRSFDVARLRKVGMAGSRHGG